MHHAASHSSRLRGIAFMIAAVCIFSIMDALLKRLSSHYAPLQVASLRCLSSLFCIASVIAWQRSWRALRPHQPLLHALRALLGIGMLSSFVYAVHRLTLAQTYALFLAAPLLMTALSVPLHGDRVSRGRWLAILAGLGGVLLILEPWGGGRMPWLASAAAAAATVCYSLSALTVRSLARGNSSLSMVFWYLVAVGAGAGILALGHWQPVAEGDWKWLAGIGISGGLGQLWLTEAFRRAPPSVVGPFEYTAILWAFAIDWLFWNSSPTIGLVVGAAIVIGSGIVVILDERRNARAAAQGLG